MFLVHEPNGNLPKPNNSGTVEYFYRMYVLHVATRTKTTSKATYFIFVP